jgi:flagellar export protein FliJ
MRQPRFSSLVQLHENREREARRVVGQLEQKRALIEERITALANERHASTTRVNLNEREQLTRYWVALDQHMHKASEMMQAVERDIEKARVVLAEAHKAHATFVKLQEIDALHKQRKDARRAERALEEFSALQFMRKVQAAQREQTQVSQHVTQQQRNDT